MAFTSEQEDALWELWGKGEPSRLIARALRSNRRRSVRISRSTAEGVPCRVGEADST